jgi:multimeric flavodoxin WrbA
MLRSTIIVGSTRVKSNIDLTANIAAEHLKREHIHVDLVKLREYRFHDCIGCRKCVEIKKCCIRDDMTDKIIPLIMKSHILIIASPVYFDNVTALTKRFMDRTWCLRGFLKNKILGAIVVGRGYGLDQAIQAIYSWGLKHEIILCHRGTRLRGYEYGEILEDKRGLSDLEKMCNRLVEVAFMIYGHYY